MVAPASSIYHLLWLSLKAWSKQVSFRTEMSTLSIVGPIILQSTHGLSVSGIIGHATWLALLQYQAATVHWTRRGARIASDGGALPVPKSASLPAKHYEIPRSGGAGYPKR